MRRQILPAIRITIVFTIVLGIAYPLAMTGVAQALFGHKANGSVVMVDGKAVGSSLLGQNFTGAEWFHPRPSAAGNDGYDPTASGASNLGPTNPDLIKAVQQRVDDYRQENGLPATATVPADAVTASGSGLDPDISIANADLQAPRVATARGLTLAKVKALIRQHEDKASLDAFGQTGVNVLELNIALLKAAH
jgi:K+-transporting ATPase ATPase C chain